MFKVGDIVEVAQAEYCPDGWAGTYQVCQKDGDEYGLCRVRDTPLPVDTIGRNDTEVWIHTQRINDQ